MAIKLWTPHPGMSQIAFEGHIEFRDVKIPVPGKDEWGLDTLERTIRGPGCDFAAEEAKLKQGDIFASYFYLQSWRPIDHPYLPGFNLSYKGVRGGSLPTPLPETAFSELVSTVNAESLSVSYNGKTIVAASKEVKYVAPTTIYRYFTRGRPKGPKFNTVDTDATIQNLDSRTAVTFSDGTTQTLAGSAPAAVATALASSPAIFVIGPVFTPVVGTPWYECQEIVQLKYP